MFSGNRARNNRVKLQEKRFRQDNRKNYLEVYKVAYRDLFGIGSRSICCEQFQAQLILFVGHEHEGHLRFSQGFTFQASSCLHRTRGSSK